MKRTRKQYSGAYKFKVALAAAKEEQTVNQLASAEQLHPNQVRDWKKQLLAEGATLFERTPRSAPPPPSHEAELYEQIGRLQMELAWLKKKLPSEVAAKRALVEPEHPNLSTRRQCDLLGLARASYYYEAASETALNLELMQRIDEQYTRTPFYGWPRMTARYGSRATRSMASACGG